MSEFDKIVEDTVELTRKTLQSKGKEYSQNSDRFSNFRRAARLLGCSAENALLGMKVKHDVSVLDIVNNLVNSGFSENSLRLCLIALPGFMERKSQYLKNYCRLNSR